MMMKDKNLKPGWRTWRFEQMATNVNVRIENPSESGMEHYVGLEHLDPDSLRIRRWGSPDDVEAGKLFFKRGDIIFAKRRAYQRKLGVAEFDGICSAHAMVLRAKPEVVLPEFLPFFMQSDLFMNRAVAISVGSLSPTINWKTMAVQEFSLPPIDEQREFSSLFESAGNCIDSLKQALDAVTMLQARMLIDHFEGTASKSKPLEDVLEKVIDYRGKSPNKTLSGVPLITARNVRDGFLDFSQTEYIPDNEFESWMTRGMPQIGDILFTTEAPLGNVARVPALRFALAQRLVCLRANENIMLSDYLYWTLRSPITQQRVVQRSTGSTVSGVKQSELRKVEVTVPSLEEQRTIASQLNAVEQMGSILLSRLKATTRMQKQLSAELL